MSNSIKANQFILELSMKPMARTGMRTSSFHVYNTQDRLIGYYCPDSKDFTPVDKWQGSFSVGLIKNIGLTR
jgi:hypothetical protein